MATYGDDANPFADPSVQSASAMSAGEYNPFDGSSAPKQAAVSAYGTTTIAPPRIGIAGIQAAEKAAYAPSLPAYGDRSDAGAHSSGGGGDSAFALREQNLIRREQMIAEREKAIEIKERHMASVGAQLPNWPFEKYPIVYHDIDAEIPADHRAMVRKFYLICLCTWLCLLWNFICICGIVFATDVTITSDTTEVIWAAIYVVLGGMGAWTLWYRNLYYALRDDSSFQRVRHLFWFFGHFVFVTVMFIGIPKWASAGIVNMSNLYKNGFPKLATMFLICMIMWGLNALASLWMGRYSFQIWRQAGGEEKATAEVNMMAAGAAASGASYAANQQMNQQQMSTV